MSNVEHHLVTVTRLWAPAPTVIGIFANAKAAETAISQAQQEGQNPDLYSVEEWRDHQRLR